MLKWLIFIERFINYKKFSSLILHQFGIPKALDAIEFANNRKTFDGRFAFVKKRR